MTTTDTLPRYPIPARLNLALAAVQLAGIFACLHAARSLHRWWELGLLALTFGALMNSVYAIIHEAEHGMLLPNRRANDTLGVLMALFFPAPFHLIRQGHIGHHMRNRSDDEAFDFYFDGEHPVWKRLQLYGILTGCYWLMVVLSNVVVLFFPFVLKRRYFEFDRPSAAFMEALNPAYARLIRWEAVAAILTHGLILWGFGIPPLRYAIVYSGFGFTWSAMQYVHHFGTERDVLKGARNLWIFAPLDLLWLNHNWHLTHHAHPTIPWPHLPDVGRREFPEREFLLPHYFRMWRGPRRSTERVENRFAGKIIR